ncbi:MAG: hypothetical protein ACPL5F_10515 [Moorellaceae bacterium]
MPSLCRGGIEVITKAVWHEIGDCGSDVQVCLRKEKNGYLACIERTGGDGWCDCHDPKWENSVTWVFGMEDSRIDIRRKLQEMAQVIDEGEEVKAWATDSG